MRALRLTQLTAAKPPHANCLLQHEFKPPMILEPSGKALAPLIGIEEGQIDSVDQDAAPRWAGRAGTLVLIRPDGYVALISDAGDVSAVSDYLAAIGMQY